MRSIDLNADLGEGFGRWSLDDAPLLDLVTSVNIACGFHAGDPMVMRTTVRAAAARGVSIGAHPGYPDLRGFGRRDLGTTPEEIAADLIYQLGALAACCRVEGTRVRYVKPHGALYHRAVEDPEAAEAIAEAVRAVDSDLSLLTLPHGALAVEGRRAGIRVVHEAFLDRGYTSKGGLVARGEQGDLLTDPRAAADRALQLVRDGTVIATDGTVLAIEAHSLCVHGDGPAARATLESVRTRLTQEGIALGPFST